MGNNLYLPPNASPARKIAHRIYVAASDKLAKVGDEDALLAYRKAERQYGFILLAEDRKRRPDIYAK